MSLERSASKAVQARGMLSQQEMQFRAPEEVVIGRDVLELISSAMYVDPMSIYREYIQNAADAVDAARKNGTLGADEPGRVDIEVDIATRTVRIRDNGSGIKQQDFVRRLSSIGASAKRNTDARGFRGVGRLAGLGYGQELVFRSRAAGEMTVSELRWDCRGLRAELRSSESGGGIAELVRGVVVAGVVDSEQYPERFFEVELRGLVRLKGDKLMSPLALAEYIGQVGPVPFSHDFTFGPEITAALRANGLPLELDVYVSGMDGPVCRPHRNAFALNDAREGVFQELELVEVSGMDGGVAGGAWILHHDYEGAIPQAAQIKGLRLRSGNIQVGDNSLLEELFPETRFNAWSVGEVHVLDRRIVPNARRDHFEQNAHLNNLFNHLLPTARTIARMCRTSSVRRKWLRQFDLSREAVEEGIAAVRQRLGSRRHRLTAIAEAQRVLTEMERISIMDILADDAPERLRSVCKTLRKTLAAATPDEEEIVSPLAALPAKRRLMYEHLFELVYACASSKAAARALVDRISAKVLKDESE